MNHTRRAVRVTLVLVGLCLLADTGLAQPAQPGQPADEPVKVYVPYEKLKGTFENEKQGVFLPYADFQKLWQAAAGAPAAGVLPTPFILSTARFTGKVSGELAVLQLELTVDILTDDWVEVPLGLGEVAVVKASLLDKAAKPEAAAPPLLRVVGGQYSLLTRGKGRRVLQIDFVRQLLTRPGLNVLSLKTPPAVITTLELTVPDENMKFDIKPMLAATTSQVTEGGTKMTRLQAFLGAGGAIEASWKPTTQAGENLEPVVIVEQVQHISVGEALINYDVALNYDIRRRGVDAFTVQLPADLRIVAVEGSNIDKWDITSTTQPAATRPGPAPTATPPTQLLAVKLFGPAKDKYSLTVKMERFLREDKAQLKLAPVVAIQALRQTGLIAISHSPRRSVELEAGARNLARVEVSRLPEPLRDLRDVVNYRFLTADYAATLAIDVVEPRIAAQHFWALAVESDRMELHGWLSYNIERVGVFQLSISLPEPWQPISVGIVEPQPASANPGQAPANPAAAPAPANIYDPRNLVGSGKDRTLNVPFRAERIGQVTIVIVAQASRAAPDAPVDFVLPLPDARNLQQFRGQVVLLLADQLRAEVGKLEQLSPLPVTQTRPPAIRNLAPAMAYEFQSIDRAKPAGAMLKIAVKPAQVSAVVDRLVNIQPGAIQQEALIHYRVQYAPVDTFFVKMPTALADAGVDISGAGIKEKPRIEHLPADSVVGAAGTRPDADAGWSYFKIVLQAPVIGDYELRVHARQSFQAGDSAKAQLTQVVVDPILAAGKLSDQNGHIAIAKSDTLAIGEPKASKNLISTDPGSPADLPVAAHRESAVLAFRYNDVPWELALPVAAQKEADVLAIMANAAIIEQVLAGDGTLNTRATFLLSSSRGDRLPFTLPAGAEKKLYEVKLNGSAAQLEDVPGQPLRRLVRLPSSAGQVTHSVLEISYGLDKASPGDLSAPALAGDVKVPVQQTIWRLWIPQNALLLSHDSAFAQLDDLQANYMVEGLLAKGFTSAGKKSGEWAFGGQGQPFTFTRQGEPGRLAVMTAPAQVFVPACWAIVLVLGLLMLPMRAYGRSFVIVLLAFLAMVARLRFPLLVDLLGQFALPAVVLVAVVWLAQWLFVRLPRSRRLAATTAGAEAGEDQRESEK